MNPAPTTTDTGAAPATREPQRAGARPTQRRSPWPYALAGLLAAHVAAMALAVKIASANGGFTPLPEYLEHGSPEAPPQAESVPSTVPGGTSIEPAVPR